MKTVVFAALALSLAAGAALAQGVPAGGDFVPPHYGASVFSRSNHSLFSWSADEQNQGNSHAAPSAASRPGERNAEQPASSARGG
jgi:hypothetical protein